MPIKTLEVKDLKLDLRNYRTVPQRSERKATHAMVTISPDRFWALTESLLDDGYHPTENIIVLKEKGIYVVKEGNRRIAALKIVFGLIPKTGLPIPSHILTRIAAVSSDWKDANESVSCVVFAAKDKAFVDKIVSLTHGKGEKAARDTWKAVARARHKRVLDEHAEPALDLLEAYLQNGTNITEQQKERWAGDYELSILEDAIKKLAPRMGYANSRELVESYPKKISQREDLERLLFDIGLKTIDFKNVRDDETLTTKYGFPPANQPKAIPVAAPGTTTPAAKLKASPSAPKAVPNSPPVVAKVQALASNDEASVIRTLKSFVPMGPHREKVVTLLSEIRTLKPSKNPYAFCFLLRSIFEISAKAYCKDHAAAGGPSATKATGEDRSLIEVLRDITAHLTKKGPSPDKAMQRLLHGAIAVMGSPDGFLSVQSMNQLVHNSSFSIDETHICTLFSNIFPLLERMNA